MCVDWRGNIIRNDRALLTDTEVGGAADSHIGDHTRASRDHVPACPGELPSTLGFDYYIHGDAIFHTCLMRSPFRTLPFISEFTSHQRAANTLCT